MGCLFVCLFVCLLLLLLLLALKGDERVLVGKSCWMGRSFRMEGWHDAGKRFHRMERSYMIERWHSADAGRTGCTYSMILDADRTQFEDYT